MKGYTFEVESPLKIADWFRLYPFYRYHTQTAAKFFLPYGEHTIQSTYYTSDFDLSTLSSQKYGLGVKISPIFGISRFKWFKHRIALFKEIDIRYAQYQRSDGLTAWSATAGFKFNIQR